MSISLYADDAVLYCSNHESCFIQNRLEQSLKHVIDWCNNNYININIDKTKFCIYGTRSNISKFEPTIITTGNKQIARYHKYQYLGVILDEWTKQNFNTVLKKYSHRIYQFGKVRKFLCFEDRVLVYKQTVLPLSEYVSFVMTLNNKQDTDKLQKLQNRALRLCYNIYDPRDLTIARLHEMAKVELLYKRRMI